MEEETKKQKVLPEARQSDVESNVELSGSSPTLSHRIQDQIAFQIDYRGQLQIIGAQFTGVVACIGSSLPILVDKAPLLSPAVHLAQNEGHG